MPETVLVIGSNSFSGGDFVDFLLDDPAMKVLGVSRSPEKSPFMLAYRGRSDLSRFRFEQIDLNHDVDRLLALIDAERPEYIVNFAAQSEVAPSWIHPEEWFETNTVALAKLVKNLAGKDFIKRYLHVSSPEAYGNCVGRVTEEAPDNPSTPYAASKAAADMLLSVYHKQYGFPVITVRATNVYGPHQQLFKIIPRTVIALKMGKRIPLHGGGVAVKSYIHIRDVSRGELAMLKRGNPGERYHLSPDEGIAVAAVVRKICELLGARYEDSVDVVGERPGQDAAYVIDSEKARKAFGWRPEIALETGAAQVVDWIEANWDAIRRQPLEYIHRP
jgi:dTDP-glucose 4,6-dehydratase